MLEDFTCGTQLISVSAQRRYNSGRKYCKVDYIFILHNILTFIIFIKDTQQQKKIKISEHIAFFLHPCGVQTTWTSHHIHSSNSLITHDMGFHCSSIYNFLRFKTREHTCGWYCGLSARVYQTKHWEITFNLNDSVKLLHLIIRFVQGERHRSWPFQPIVAVWHNIGR